MYIETIRTDRIKGEIEAVVSDQFSGHIGMNGPGVEFIRRHLPVKGGAARLRQPRFAPEEPQGQTTAIFLAGEFDGPPLQRFFSQQQGTKDHTGNGIIGTLERHDEITRPVQFDTPDRKQIAGNLTGIEDWHRPLLAARSMGQTEIGQPPGSNQRRSADQLNRIVADVITDFIDQLDAIGIAPIGLTRS